MIKIKFIEEYLTYPKGKVLTTTKSNAENLFILGVAEEVKEEVEKPKRGRKPKNKEELKDSIETK
jgi:hypothetical protein